jgi:hypothetical protein
MAQHRLILLSFFLCLVRRPVELISARQDDSLPRTHATSPSLLSALDPILLIPRPLYPQNQFRREALLRSALAEN